MLHRDTLFQQAVCQVFGLLDTGIQVIIFYAFTQAAGQCIHIPPRHAAIGQETFEHNIVGAGLFVPVLFTECDETANVHIPVFLTAHGDGIRVGEHFCYNIRYGHVFIAFLAFLDEIGIFGKAGCIIYEGDGVLVSQGFDFPHVLHGYRLSACGIAGQGKDDKRDIICIFLQHMLKDDRINIALERVNEACIVSFLNGTVQCCGFPVFYMTLGRVEMGIARGQYLLL